jgi:hypothetical protein
VEKDLWLCRIEDGCREDSLRERLREGFSLGKLDGRTYDEFPLIQRGEIPDSRVRKTLAAQFEDVWPIPPAARRQRTA